jgi:hypothetical protein
MLLSRVVQSHGGVPCYLATWQKQKLSYSASLLGLGQLLVTSGMIASCYMIAGLEHLHYPMQTFSASQHH